VTLSPQSNVLMAVLLWHAIEVESGARKVAVVCAGDAVLCPTTCILWFRVYSEYGFVSYCITSPCFIPPLQK